jgi:hypothetical protein
VIDKTFGQVIEGTFDSPAFKIRSLSPYNEQQEASLLSAVRLDKYGTVKNNFILEK